MSIERADLGARGVFYRLRAGFRGGADLLGVWIDEQADHDSRAAQLLHHGSHRCLIAGGIQPAFRRHFLASLGYERHLVRLGAERQLRHFRNGRHLEINLDLDELLQRQEIAILNVTAIEKSTGRRLSSSLKNVQLPTI